MDLCLFQGGVISAKGAKQGQLEFQFGTPISLSALIIVALTLESMKFCLLAFLEILIKNFNCIIFIISIKFFSLS